MVNLINQHLGSYWMELYGPLHLVISWVGHSITGTIICLDRTFKDKDSSWK